MAEEVAETMKTQILIIALDGLEYDYIIDRNLPFLKQLEHGKVQVPITEAGEPSTPIVWTSFVTGKPPSEHGISVSSVYQNRMIGKIMYWAENKLSNKMLRRVLMFFTPIIKRLKRFKTFQAHQPTKELIIVPTMFDLIPSSISVSVPVLNYDVDTRYQGILEAITEPEARIKYLDFLMSDFEQDKQQFLGVLNRYNMIMVHFQLPDLYGHIYCRNMRRINDLYSMLNDFVGEIIKQVDGDCWILIISDHGIDKNFGHSDHGFYSSSVRLGLTTPNIIDFYNLIMEVCV